MKYMTPTWISEYIVDSVLEYQIPTTKSIMSSLTTHEWNVIFHKTLYKIYGIGFAQNNIVIE